MTSRIADLLQEGFGAEDISLKMGLPLDVVRFEIRKMRRMGMIDRMFPHE